MLDMTESIAPKSDQLNAEDLLTGPRTFTIADVKRGDAEQPIHVHLAEFPGRPFKPSKTVRRIMVGAWGPDAEAYVGRRLTLYRDPAVRFGGQDVGGIRVSHMSHLSKRLTIALTVTRGKRAPYVVEPLPNEPAPATAGSTAGITEQQSRKLHATLGDLGVTERTEALALLSRLTGRDIDSSKNLTRAEAAHVIDELTRMTQPASNEPDPDAHRDDEPPAEEPPVREDWPETAQPGSGA